MFCGECGVKAELNDKFCGACGEVIKSESAAIPVVPQDTAHPTSDINPAQSDAGLNTIGIVLLVICAILWLAAPFLSINIMTLSHLGGQPSAWQLITGDVIVLGNISNSPAYWVAVFSAIGISLCLVCAFTKKNVAVCVFAVLTNIVLLIAGMDTLSVFRLDLSGLPEVAGSGYFGILILLVITCIVFGKKKV